MRPHLAFDHRSSHELHLGEPRGAEEIIDVFHLLVELRDRNDDSRLWQTLTEDLADCNKDLQIDFTMISRFRFRSLGFLVARLVQLLTVLRRFVWKSQKNRRLKLSQTTG